MSQLLAPFGAFLPSIAIQKRAGSMSHSPCIAPSRLLLCIIAVLYLAIAGCGVTPSQPDIPVSDIADETSEAAIEEPEEEELPPKPFSEATLMNLLVGELAVYNRDIAAAAAQYKREALITRDAAVAERAARLTRYLRDKQAALSMGQLWYELDADNRQAAANLADLYARDQQPSASLGILESQLQKGQDPSFSVLRNTKFKSADERTAIINRLNQIAIDYPESSDNYSLVFIQTLLLQQNGQPEEALEKAKVLKQFESNPVQLAKIEAQLLSELERYEEATDVLAKALKKHPDEKTLRFEYARKLTKHDMEKAQLHFTEMLADYPDEPKLLMHHALVASDNKDYDAAKQSLNTLLEKGKSIPFAHYNLGLIAHTQKDWATSAKHFKKVRQGDKLLPAIQKVLSIYQEQNELDAAREYLSELRGRYSAMQPTLWAYEASLLSEDNREKEAHELLTTALEQFPDQHELRMQRAFLSDKLQRLDMAEYDLTYILRREPNNANALNTLGYILADKTTRYIEAADYIRKALDLIPESAAVMDSMGWVLYKLGEYDEALTHLNRAYEKMKDDEIAAHLIEVYWNTGDTGKAKKIYRSIQKHSDEHPLVDSIIQKLQIEF